MKFTAGITFSLLVGNTIAAPAPIAAARGEASSFETGGGDPLASRLIAPSWVREMFKTKTPSPSGGGLASDQTLERRQFDPYPYLDYLKKLEKERKEKEGGVERRGESPALDQRSGALFDADSARQYFSRWREMLGMEVKATPQRRDGAEPTTEGPSDSGQDLLEELNEYVLEMLEKLSPEDVEQLSSLVARDDGDSTAANALLASRGENPALDKRFTPDFVKALLDYLRAKFGINIPQDQVQRRSESPFSETDLVELARILLESLGEYIPDDAEEFSRLVAREDGGSATPGGAVERRAAPLLLAWSVIFIASSLGSHLMQVPETVQRRDLTSPPLEGVGPAFDQDVAGLIRELLGEISPEDLESISSLVARGDGGSIAARDGALERRAWVLVPPVFALAWVLGWTGWAIGHAVTSGPKEETPVTEARRDLGNLGSQSDYLSVFDEVLSEVAPLLETYGGKIPMDEDFVKAAYENLATIYPEVLDAITSGDVTQPTSES